MRILHTSDWHLGVSLHDRSLADDQSQFLDWLLETLERKKIHALLIAGDVYHFAQPSNTARQLLNRFLADCRQIEHLNHVVITGGNHDSASTLETPIPLLESTNVHILADARDATRNPSKHVIPLTNEDHNVQAVVSAIPYVHSWHLGVRSAELSIDEERAEIGRAFADLYQSCADIAEEKHPGIPRLAMGHLTCGPAKEEDFVTNVHQLGSGQKVGGIQGFTPQLFGENYDYVALGHIHRPYRVEGDIWYSGTPIPTRFTETKPTRSVRIIDCDDDGQLSSENLAVPKFRDIVLFKGSFEEIKEQVSTYSFDSELPPFVGFEVIIEGMPDSTLRDSLSSLLPEDAAIVSFSQRKDIFLNTDGESSNNTIPNLDTVPLKELFTRLYYERHGQASPPETLMQAFNKAVDIAHGGKQ